MGFPVPAEVKGLCGRGGTDMGRFRKGEAERYGAGPAGGVLGREGGPVTVFDRWR